MRSCPDCQTNLDEVPAGDPCPGCGGRSATITAGFAEVQVTSPEVSLEITRGNRRPSWEKWRLVHTCLSKLEEGYSPGGAALGNAEVEHRAETFFFECDNFADWLKGDLEALPGVRKRKVERHWQTDPALRKCNDISRTHKHHSPSGRAARIRSTKIRSGGLRVAIEIDWASESANKDDALELARECVTSWRKFFAKFGIVEP